MIGTRAFLLDLALPLFWWLMICAMLAVIMRSSRQATESATPKIRNRKIQAVVVLIVVTFGAINGTWRLVRQIHWRSALHNLTPESVEWIRVGECRIATPADVNAVVGALRESQWYVTTAGDGGWGQKAELVIHLKSGEEERYLVGQFRKREGAVIDLVTQDANSHFVGHFGYAYAGRIPGVLEQIGIHLPKGNSNGF